MLPVGNKYKQLRTTRPQKRKYLYSAKTYKNPFFQNKRSRVGQGESGNIIKLAIFAAVLTTLLLIWLLFFSKLFKISNIEISGANDNLKSETEAAVWKVAGGRVIGKNNLLLFDKTALNDVLQSKFYLSELTIKKKLFHTLKISLTEKQQAAIWREDDKYYYIDSDGIIISQVDTLNINNRDYPLIENQTELKINDRQANINRDSISCVNHLFNEFKDNKHNLAVERFIVDKETNTIKVSVLDGPKIFYNIKADLAEQTAKLDIVIKEKLKDNFRSKEHIDLRYSNNVYIK